METKLFSIKDETAKFIYPLLIAVAITSILYYIDQGFYTFKWMLNFGNWIAFFIYTVGIYLLQLIIIFPFYKLAPRLMIDSGKMFLIRVTLLHFVVIVLL